LTHKTLSVIWFAAQAAAGQIRVSTPVCLALVHYIDGGEVNVQPVHLRASAESGRNHADVDTRADLRVQ
jgi:hypothetical protein